MSPADKGEEENGKVDVEAAAISTGRRRRKQASKKKSKKGLNKVSKTAHRRLGNNDTYTSYNDLQERQKPRPGVHTEQSVHRIRTKNTAIDQKVTKSSKRRAMRPAS